MASLAPPSTNISDHGDSPFQAILNSVLMILASEVGDKTFLIAAILAMRHPRLVVFSGAFSSLALMSLLSACMGHILPSLLLSRKWTQLAAAVLFGVFGVKMWLEARGMLAGSGKIEEEMREAEGEIEEDEEGVGMLSPGAAIPLGRLDAAEGGQSHIRIHTSTDGDVDSSNINVASTAPSASPPSSPAKPKGSSFKDGARNFCSLMLGPVFVQAFVLTFLGEWGDRSQIATIALGAAHNVYLVTLGTVLGHAFCTALAVIGGRYVSTKISVKHVTYGGAVLFLLFAAVYFYEAYKVGGSESVEVFESLGRR